MKNNKELDELVESIIDNLKYDPDNWTSINEDNGYHEIVEWVRTLDWTFTVLTKSLRINAPYKYAPSQHLKDRLKVEIDKIIKRDMIEVVKLNKNFTQKIESYKDKLDTYTDETKAEMIRESRENKLTRVLKYFGKK